MRVGASELGKKVARVEAASRTPNYALSLPERFLGHKMEKKSRTLNFATMMPSYDSLPERAPIENMRNNNCFQHRFHVLTTQNTAAKAN